MKNTWGYGNSIHEFLKKGESEEAKVNEITGEINANSSSFCILETQRDAWTKEVQLLRKILRDFDNDSNRIYFEFDLMRFSKRVDVVLVINGILICLEFKTDRMNGATEKCYTEQDKMQVMAYADEFAQFHSTSRKCPIVPVLVVAAAPDVDDPIMLCCENIFDVMRTNENVLGAVLKKIITEVPTKMSADMTFIADAIEWEKGEYETVPTIVEAADRLFENQKVEAITRSGTDVTKTMEVVRSIIRAAERNNERVVCFVTGEPGAGKTLVGLKIASERMEREKAVSGKDKLIRKVLLSGNYPLVKILQESLIRNLTTRLAKCKKRVNCEGGILTAEEKQFIEGCGFEMKSTGRVKKVKTAGGKKNIEQFELYTINSLSDKGKRIDEVKDVNQVKFKPRKLTKLFITATISSMIQLVSHFRRGWEISDKAPSENVFIFDESQRAWDADQVKAKDKKTHKDQIDRGWSEPKTLLEYLNRHGENDWCVAICLVGTGQDIHSGEAGINGWYEALCSSDELSKWKICTAPKTVKTMAFKNYFHDQKRVNPDWNINYAKLHLSANVRSFRSKNVGPFVNALLEGRRKLDDAKKCYEKIVSDQFPLFLTRDKNVALTWIGERTLHGERRCGSIMSSRAVRLRRYGFITQGMGFDEISWFLDGSEIINSSCAMELSASEFKIQGLELDYVLMGWDGDFVFNPESGTFICRHFSKRDNQWKAVHKVTEDENVGDVNGEKDDKLSNSRDRERHLKNAYRVLLTRARQGMIIYIPEGEPYPVDKSNISHENYDPTYNYLHDEVGVKDISEVEG